MCDRLFKPIPLLLLISVGLSLQSLLAQDYAELSGRVVDQTGAVLPGASLTLSHEASGHFHRATSDETGDFVFPFVPAGAYTLTIELPGFSTLKMTGIHLSVGQELQLRPELKPGAPATEITVESDPNRIETKTSVLRDTATEEEIEGLPVLLSPQGRQSLNDLILLVPGASDSDPNGIPNRYGWSTTINGSPIGSIGFSLDGADYTALSRERGGAHSPGPNPDALAEFTVETGLFKAESGSHPAMVHMQIKSGGGDFHGQLRAIHMNPSISARPFFAPPSQYSGGPNQNSIGGQFSGPVILPGLYRGRGKTYFFFDMETTRTRSESVDRVSVFSEGERAGDFSDLPMGQWPVDPLTEKVFPEGRIPESRILPQSRFYVDSLIPRPEEGKLWEGSGSTTYRGWQPSVRIDHQFSPDDTLNVSFSNFDTMIRIALPAMRETLDSISETSPSLAIRHTHSFSPRMANSFVFGRSQYRYKEVVSGRFNDVDPGEYGFNISLGAKDGKGLPRVIIYSTNTFDPGGQQLIDSDTVWSWADDLSYVKGSHSFKWGARTRRARAESLISPTPLFQFAAFNPMGTRNDVADFLLGIPLSYAQSAAIENYPRRTISALYFQDDFKLRVNLSLNLGIRYEMNGVWSSADGRNAIFRPDEQSRIFTNAPAGILFPGDRDPWSGETIGGAMTPPDHNNFAPRIGLAYSPEAEGGFWGRILGGPGRTAFRAGYGIYYICSRADAVTHETNLPPWFFAARRDAPTIAAAGGNFADPWGSDGNPFPVPLDARLFSSPLAGLIFVDPAMVDPYQHQWSFSIQRQLPRDLALELAYVGNTALHLHRKFEANPGLLIPSASISNLESRRQYPGFGSVPGYISDGVSSYHALQVLLNRRYTSGLQFNAHYTWSKGLDNTGGSIVNGIFGFGDRDSTTWARANSDRKHQFVFLGTSNLPGFRKAGILGHLFSGWRASGVFQLRSGLPLDIRNSVDSTLIGAEPGTPDIIGPFRRLDPREVQTFTMPNGRQQTGSFIFDPTVFQPLYPQSPEEARPGNLGRNSLTGPGRNQVDLSLARRFAFGERHHIHVRADFLNLFNHTQFIVANRNSFKADYATFGMASSLPPRRIQFMLKYSF